MMKRILKNALALAVIFFSGRAQAQYSYGLEPAMNIYSDEIGAGGCIGMRFQNFTNDDGTLFFESYLGLGFPKTRETTLKASAINMYYSPGSINVPMTQKMTFFFVDAGVGKMFTGDYEDGGVLCFGALDFTFFSVKNTVGVYNRDQYYINISPQDREMGGTIHLKPGLGYLIRTGQLGIIPTVSYSLRVLNRNNEDTEFKVPDYLSIGVRVMIFPE